MADEIQPKFTKVEALALLKLADYGLVAVRGYGLIDAPATAERARNKLSAAIADQAASSRGGSSAKRSRT